MEERRSWDWLQQAESLLALWLLDPAWPTGRGAFAAFETLTFFAAHLSFFCAASVSLSLLSSISSSLNVGLKGFSILLPGVPGTLMALFRGDFGVIGMLMT